MKQVEIYYIYNAQYKIKLLPYIIAIFILTLWRRLTHDDVIEYLNLLNTSQAYRFL